MSDIGLVALLIVVCAGCYIGARASLEPPKVKRPYTKRGFRR